MITPRTRTLVAAGAAGVLLVACGSSSHRAAVSGTVGTTAAPPSATTTSSSGTAHPTTTPSPLATTVPDCGAGAFQPATLLIQCATGGTTATDIRWSSWGRDRADGSGTVHLAVGGRPVVAPARLELSSPVTGPSGPQFSRLTVTWTASSPDGRASDDYALAATR